MFYYPIHIFGILFTCPTTHQLEAKWGLMWGERDGIGMMSTGQTLINRKQGRDEGSMGKVGSEQTKWKQGRDKSSVCKI